jgi:putative DNA primase/helicase
LRSTRGLLDTLGTFTSGDTLARAIKAGAAEHYGMAGPAFVQQLVGKLDHLADNIRRGVDDFVSDHLPANSNGQVSRACRRIGLVAAAGEIAASLGVLPWRVGVSTEAAASIFSSWLEARGGAGPAEDRAILEHVRAYLIQHGQSRFQPLLGEAHYTIVNRVGFYREDGSGNREYLVPSSSWKEVCQGAPGGEKAVRELLRRRGHLAIDSSGKGQLPISLPGMGRTRCYTIRPSIFEDGQDA